MICGHGHEQKFKYPYPRDSKIIQMPYPRAKAIDQNPVPCPASPPPPRRLDIDRCFRTLYRRTVNKTTWSKPQYNTELFSFSVWVFETPNKRASIYHERACEREYIPGYLQRTENRPFPHSTSVRTNNSNRARLGWTFSYIHCIFVHPNLDSVPLSVGMRERSTGNEFYKVMSIGRQWIK